jgi:hypothetical protein
MEEIMTKKTLGPAHRSLMTAANDQYHAVASINQHGEINHAQAVANVLLNTGKATTQAQAVQMAANEVEHVTRIANGEMVNREARKLLDAKPPLAPVPGTGRFGGAHQLAG